MPVSAATFTVGTRAASRSSARRAFATGSGVLTPCCILHIIMHMHNNRRSRYEEKIMGGREPRLLEVYAGRERRATVLVAGVASEEGRCPAAGARNVERCLSVLGYAA